MNHSTSPALLLQGLGSCLNGVLAAALDPAALQAVPQSHGARGIVLLRVLDAASDGAPTWPHLPGRLCRLRPRSGGARPAPQELLDVARDGAHLAGPSRQAVQTATTKRRRAARTAGASGRGA